VTVASSLTMASASGWREACFWRVVYGEKRCKGACDPRKSHENILSVIREPAKDIVSVDCSNRAPQDCSVCSDVGPIPTNRAENLLAELCRSRIARQDV
jgi:hypothetical protein